MTGMPMPSSRQLYSHQLISQQCTNAQAKCGPCIQWDISLKKGRKIQSRAMNQMILETGDDQRTDATQVTPYEVSRRVRPRPKSKYDRDQHSEAVCLLEIARGAQNAGWQWLHKRPRCHWTAHSDMITVVSLWRNVYISPNVKEASRWRQTHKHMAAFSSRLWGRSTPSPPRLRQPDSRFHNCTCRVFQAHLTLRHYYANIDIYKAVCLYI